jgi:hypothetical protein
LLHIRDANESRTYQETLNAEDNATKLPLSLKL